MTSVTISEARDRLSTVIDQAQRETVYLTRRSHPVAAIVNPEFLAQLLEDAAELSDIRAVDEAWDETERLSEVPVPWDEVKRELGL